MVSTFFTLDRANSLSSELTIILTSIIPNTPELTYLSDLYELGISRHGCNYLLDPKLNLWQSDRNMSAIIEIMLEERRKSKYPEKPSRFQSVFACETKEDALWLCGKFQYPTNSPIYKIDTDSFHRGDMNLLSLNCTPLELSHRLDLYWQEETEMLYDGYFPFWEITIPLPVQIGDRISI
ncbi:MAG TPA: hypothetical protein ACHBY6_07800 [Arsenophonus apicola]